MLRAAPEVAFRAIEGYQYRTRLEAHPPVKIANEIAERDSGIQITRCQLHPALLIRPDNDCTVFTEDENGTVSEALVSRKSNRHVGPLVGSTSEPAALDIGALDGQIFDAVMMLELMEPLRNARIARRSDDLRNRDHGDPDRCTRRTGA